ncbi:hypothetical protein [Rubinisphaera margarita]|uniref:hypothetical protein n=1 Tax=Rubinisphaera margarita TaxID=2909586 RepID=UPI001EE7AE37|nr:hypothetical protein [Rubinisphaera margarita]MCG6155647.1 hypothetical protein [Rubinisphaera margarita]
MSCDTQWADSNANMLYARTNRNNHMSVVCRNQSLTHPSNVSKRSAMCLALYLFTEESLPESEWIEDEPKVFVQAIENRKNQYAAKWLDDNKRIYYIGGYQGCGCGWLPVNEFDEPNDVEARQRDRMVLGQILRSIDLKSSWLVACWEGDEEESLFTIETITIEQIEDPGFAFVELQPYRIHALKYVRS